MSYVQILKISLNELLQTMFSPITATILVFFLIFSIINVANFYSFVSISNSVGVPLDYQKTFVDAVQNLTYILTSIIMFLSINLTIVSFGDERSKGTLTILSAKPVYRRDIISGKYLGINAFLVLLIIFIISIFVSLMIMFFGTPESVMDIFFRLVLQSILLMMYCAVSMGITILFVMLLKNNLEAYILSIFFVIVEWLMLYPFILNYFDWFNVINPSKVFFNILGSGPGILNIHYPVGVWFGLAFPYVLLLIMELFAIFIFDLYLYGKIELS
jgi:ABC-2 type transport system permease protein